MKEAAKRVEIVDRVTSSFHHRECKNCAEACAEMIKECKAVLGA